jgi:hypothetical protein
MLLEPMDRDVHVMYIHTSFLLYIASAHAFCHRVASAIMAVRRGWATRKPHYSFVCNNKATLCLLRVRIRAATRKAELFPRVIEYLIQT